MIGMLHFAEEYGVDWTAWIESKTASERTSES